MNILSFGINGCNLEIVVNVALVALLILLFFVGLLLRRGVPSFGKIVISEARLGIGKSFVTLKCSHELQEIAHKIRIELVTRKIGLLFDEENDVIVEVYDSWYESFKMIRVHLKDIPMNQVRDMQKLVDLSIKVLNVGLRPHLTKWQAKFRKWYEHECLNSDESPQEIQKKYPQYKEMIEDMKKTNQIMMEYAEQLKEIIEA